MGKVGSSSIAKSLENGLPGIPVYHVHTLSEERLREMEDANRGYFANTGIIHYHILNGLFLREQFWPERDNTCRCKAISLVREPVSRNISTFFQDLRLVHHRHGFYDRIVAGGDDSLVEDMTRFFIESFDQRNGLEWFDKEVKQHLGIDVLAEAFPTSQGFNTYTGKRADLLLIRLEDLSECGTKAIREFMGIDAFRLGGAQRGSRKYYSEVYRRFLDQIVLPDKLLDLLYGSRLVTTFYSPEEIAAFRKKWSGTS